MHRLPVAGAFQHLAFAIDDLRDDAEERPGRRAGLEPRRARQRGDQNPAGLGLPPGVDDRATAFADHAVVPLPRLRIDRLADGAEQPQRLARGLLHRLVAGLHQRPDRGRRGVDDVDLVLVANLPEAGHARIVRHALENHRGGAVRERSIDDVAVPGDPADVGGAPVDVAVVVVEDVLVRHRHVDVVAAGRVQHAFRLPGRARGVEDEQRVLRVHVLARTLRGHDLGGLVVPDVAHRIHVDLAAGAANDDHVIDAADLGDGGIGIGLERHFATAAHAFIRRDDDLGLAVLDAPGERVGREAAEHHRVDGADARASEHGVDGLRDHRQVDGDAIALHDVAVAQDVGEAADLVVQLLIGDVLRLCRVVALPDDRDLAGARRQMAVDAVVGGVGDAVLEPFDRDVAGTEGRVLDLGRRPIPMDALGLLGPEPVRVLERARVHLLVLGLVDKAALLPLRRNIVHLVRHRFCLHAGLRLGGCRAHGRCLGKGIMRWRPDERQAGRMFDFGRRCSWRASVERRHCHARRASVRPE